MKRGVMMRTGLFVCAAVVALSGCSNPSSPPPPGGEDSVNPGPNVAVTITMSSTDHNVVSSRNLLCGSYGEGGTHPDVAKACDAMQTAVALKDDPFEPVSGDVACTEQYGGPEQANIRGKINGEEIDVDFSRTKGCEITRWDALEGVWFDPLK